jgi:uncharacterized membrane protein YgcG
MRVHFTRWVLVPAIMVGWLSFSGTASAQANKRSGPARTVEDDGGFFSEKAKQKANEEIAQIKRKFDKDLLIETFSKAPESISKVNLKDPKEKDEFFLKWAKDRASNADVRGVYVLICKQPSYVRVIEGRRERDSGAFTNDNAKELAKILIGKLKEKKNDEALQEAVAYVHKVFQDHAGRTGGESARGIILVGLHLPGHFRGSRDLDGGRSDSRIQWRRRRLWWSNGWWWLRLWRRQHLDQHLGRDVWRYGRQLDL